MLATHLLLSVPVCFARTHVCLCSCLLPLHWLGAGTAQKRADKKGNLNSINASRLAFHTDQGATDLIALVSVTAAPEGGESKWVSAIAIHNELLRRGRKVYTVNLLRLSTPGNLVTLSLDCQNSLRFREIMHSSKATSTPFNSTFKMRSLIFSELGSSKLDCSMHLAILLWLLELNLPLSVLPPCHPYPSLLCRSRGDCCGALPLYGGLLWSPPTLWGAVVEPSQSVGGCSTALPVRLAGQVQGRGCWCTAVT